MKKSEKRTKLSPKSKASVGLALDEFYKLVQLGYTHDNFYTIYKILGGINRHLWYDEVKLIETAWRDSFTDSCDETMLAVNLESIKSRLS